MKANPLSDEKSFFLSVEDILLLPSFSNAKVIVGGDFLKNPSYHMVSLDSPYGLDFAIGGEFVLTSGYVLNDISDLLGFIDKMKERRISAFAIKEKYFSHLPEEVLKKADENQIPILLTGLELNFTKAISEFYEKLFYEKNKYLIEIKNTYEKLALLSYGQKNPKDILIMISEMLKTDLYLYDTGMNVISLNKAANVFNENKFEAQLQRFALEGEEIECIKDYFLTKATLVSHDGVYGYLISVGKAPLSKLHFDILQITSHLLAINEIKASCSFNDVFEIKKSITQLVLSGNKIENSFYENISNHYGFTENAFYYGIHFSDNTNTSPALRKLLYKLIDKLLGNVPYLPYETAQSITIFAAFEQAQDISKFVAVLSEEITKISKKLSVSISDIGENLQSIDNLCEQCKITANFNSPGEILYYRDIEFIKMLHGLKINIEIISFHKKVIGALKQYDNNHNGQLMLTLKTYFELDCNKKSSAQKLFIHLETLRYRLAKIQELTGYSPYSSDGMFILQLAINMDKIL